MARFLISMSAAALACVCSPALAQVMTPPEYMAAAGAGDLYERQSSEIILRSTANPELRSFAQMMIDHHTKSSADVKAAAQRAKLVTPAPILTPAQAEMIAQLLAEPAATRDATYLAQQKAAHGQALAVQKAFAADGRPAPLRNAAQGIVPTVESHIDMLKAM